MLRAPPRFPRTDTLCPYTSRFRSWLAGCHDLLVSSSFESADPWALVSSAAEAIALRTSVERHDVLVVQGSGWVPAAERFGEVTAEVPVAELPGFPSIDRKSTRLNSSH